VLIFHNHHRLIVLKLLNFTLELEVLFLHSHGLSFDLRVGLFNLSAGVVRNI
jgi:hypothetical protein